MHSLPEHTPSRKVPKIAFTDNPSMYDEVRREMEQRRLNFELASTQSRDERNQALKELALEGDKTSDRRSGEHRLHVEDDPDLKKSRYPQGGHLLRLYREQASIAIDALSDAMRAHIEGLKITSLTNKTPTVYSQNVLTDIENGDRRPTWASLEVLVHLLNLKAEEEAALKNNFGYRVRRLVFAQEISGDIDAIEHRKQHIDSALHGYKNLLRAFRSKRGMSLDQLREKTGVEKKRLSKLDKGEELPTEEEFTKLCAAYALSAFDEGLFREFVTALRPVL